MSTLSLDAGNDLPERLSSMTALSAEGAGFTPCGHVIVSVHAGDIGGRVVGFGTVAVDLTGGFSWSALTPRLGRDTALTAIAHDRCGGRSVIAQATVFSPGDLVPTG